MLTSLHINAQAFAAVATFKAEHDVRYYLNGVHVQPHPAGGVVIIATDGHTLAGIWDRTGHTSGPAVLRVSPELVRAASNRKAVDLELSAGVLAVRQKIGEALAPLYIQPGETTIDGRFPDWQRVLPSRELKPRAVTALSAAYVARMAKVAKLLAPKHGGMLRMLGQADTVEGNGPAVLQLADVPDFFAIVMPMRCDDPAAGLPDWTAMRPAQSAAVVSVAGG